ncbi:MAG: HAD family hydrolase [Herpetosiphon sp.]
MEDDTVVEALIFDFDGLLVDTETPAYESWVEIFHRHGVELPHSLYQRDIGTVGVFDPAAELSRLTGKPIDDADLWSVRQGIKERLSAAQPLLPGVSDFLADGSALGLPMAVASSSGRAWVVGWLERHNIRSFFRCVVTRDDVDHVKPAPDLFLKAAACLETAPQRCLVFEDSPPGMRAAEAAGMRCVAVPSALTRDLPMPDVALKLGSLSELRLAALLERLTRSS